MYQGKCLKGREVQGQVQILQYEGHAYCNFFYQWITYEEWKLEQPADFRVLVRCGSSTPVLWAERSLLGNLNLESRQADFAAPDGEVFRVRTLASQYTPKHCSQVSDEGSLKHLLVIVRNYRDRPPHCGCDKCQSEKATAEPLVMINEWLDYRTGTPYAHEKQR